MRAGRINLAVVYAAIGLHVLSAAHGQVNSWTNTANGPWHFPANWSLGVAPASSQSGIVISNSSTKLVTVDAISASQFPSTLTIKKLWLSAPAGFQNTLQLRDAGLTTPFRILGGARIQQGGALFIANATLQVGGSLTDDGALTIAGGVASVDRFLTLGSARGTAGSVWVNGGTLAINNAPTFIGRSGDGQLTVSNGTFAAQLVNVGGFQDSHGTLTVTGGAVDFVGRLAIGTARGSQGSVWVTGGELSVTNASTIIGNFGNGEMSVSNGAEVVLRRATIGAFGRASGTLTIKDSAVNVIEGANIGNGLSTHGSVAVDSGALNVTNGTLRVGLSGDGQLTISSGQVFAQTLEAGTGFLGRGNITVAGGTLAVERGVTLSTGDGSTAALWVTGGAVSMADYRANIFEFSPSLTVGSGGQIAISNGSFYADSAGMNHGTLTVAGGTMMISNGLSVTEGKIWVTGGEFLPESVGLFSSEMIISNGTVRGSAIGLSSPGTLSLLGGKTSLNYLSAIGATNAPPTIWIKGGELNVDWDIRIGDVEVGAVTISNGIVNTAGLGLYAGTLTVAGGTVNVQGLTINQTENTFWMTGGVLNAPTGQVNLAFNGFGGRWVISNGIAFIQSTIVGAGAEVRQEGGVLEYSQNLTLTDVGWGGSARYFLNGGTLSVTNGVVAIGENGYAELTVNGGTMQAGTFQIGTYERGGTLTVNAGTVECRAINLGVVGTLSANGGAFSCAGDLTMSPGAVVRVGLGSYDQMPLEVNGSANLTGELRIQFAGNFQSTITNGASFVLINAGSITGTFTNVAGGARLGTDDGVGSFVVGYSPATVRLTGFQRAP